MTQADSTTSLVFTRPLSPFDSDKEALSAEQGDEATFIWGYGKENALATHSHHSRGTVVLVDLFCGEAVEEDDKGDDDDEDRNDDHAGGSSDDDSASGDDADDAGGNNDDSAGGNVKDNAGSNNDVNTATAEVCASSDPDYEFEVSPRRDLALLWGVTDGGTLVKVKVRSRTKGTRERGRTAGEFQV